MLSGQKTKLDKLTFLQKIAIPNGVLIAIIEFVFLLARLDDWKAFGPGVVDALIAIVYALLLYLVVTILKARCEKETLEC